MNKRRKTKYWIGLSPWIILGALFVMVPLFLFMTLENINRQKENTTKLLEEKGAALIRSFEAGARTGIMRMRWGGSQVQRLLSETAKQPDIVYLLVTDSTGNILAHSESSMIGNRYGIGLNLGEISKSDRLKTRMLSKESGYKIFEVFRKFSPLKGRFRRRHHPGMMRKDWFSPHMHSDRTDFDTRQVIFVGLDMGPIEAAQKEDVRHTIIMGLTFLLIGFAGIVALFLAQAYKSARSSLSKVKAFSDNLVENMPIGLAATDEKERVTYFNRAAESILEKSSAEVLLKPSTEVLPEAIVVIINKLKSRNGFIEEEIQFLVHKDKTVSLEIVATSLQEEDGTFLGYIILFRDLTQIHKLKAEIARSQRLASIGSLAAGVAHEIRNPLSSIKGFATYFKERYRDIPNDLNTAEVMIQEVDRLNRVINQLLEFARPMKIQKKLTDLKLLITHSLKLVEGDNKKKRLNVRLDLKSDDVKVMIDPDLFKQVLLNLYLNALEAMEEGGTLIVAYEKQDEDRTIITISDTGCGIGEEDLAHIFDPYFTSKSSGTGLGLAIVHKIVESHGGKIKVESKVGEGTTVSIVLPS